MPEIGQTISHYRITGNLGKGGMGEVFLADDTILGRKVALKFLPDAFNSDPERMARFEREAKLLASLSHPNIAGIYGLELADGIRFLVMEYVEGETLQARLSKGALPLEDVLELCHQIAEGLEAAHEKGVIHRDLKPANVMVTAEEKVKILDFGLAKAFSDDTQSIDSSQSPTLTEAMTRPGVILGTAAYMSPEQAKGKSVDKRADIWAFGCILYECFTGKKAFEGETVTEALAAILRGEPNWELLPATTPQNIRFVLRRCLEKERNRRFRDAADVQISIEDGLVFSSKPQKATSETNGWRRTWIPVLAVIVIFILGGMAAWILNLDGEMEYFLNTQYVESQGQFSPEGGWLAYQSNESGRSEVYVRQYPKTGDKWKISRGGGYIPLWSHDGSELYYRNDDKMMVVAIKTKPTFSHSEPKTLFEGLLEGQFGPGDVAPDGRFLMVQPVEPESPATKINLILNWFEELNQKAPLP